MQSRLRFQVPARSAVALLLAAAAPARAATFITITTTAVLGGHGSLAGWVNLHATSRRAAKQLGFCGFVHKAHLEQLTPLLAAGADQPVQP